MLPISNCEKTGRRANVDDSFRNQFLLFLIVKHLKSVGCNNAAESLEKELKEKNMLGMKFSWRGNGQPASFRDYCTRFTAISDTHLMSIISNLSLDKDMTIINPINHPRNASISMLDHMERTKSSSHRLMQDFFSSQFKKRAIINGHLSHGVYTIKFDRSGKYVVTGADDCLVKLWDLSSCRLVHTLRGHFNVIMDLSISYDNSYVATAAADNLIRIWDLHSGMPVTVLAGHTNLITAIMFMNSANILISSSDDGTVRLWNLVHDVKISTAFAGGNCRSIPFEYLDCGRSHKDFMKSPVRCISLNPFDEFIVAGCVDGTILIWEHEIPSMLNFPMDKCTKSRLNKSIKAHSESVTDISFSWRGERFLSASLLEGYVKIWLQNKNKEWTNVRILEVFSKEYSDCLSASNKRMKGPLISLDSVIWISDDSKIVTSHSIKKSRGLFEQWVRVFCSVTGKLLFEGCGHQSVVNLVPHPKYPNLICTAGHDGEVRIWNIDLSIGSHQTCRFSNWFRGGNGSILDERSTVYKVPILDAAFSPDGSSLVIADKCGCWSLFGSTHSFDILDVEVAVGNRSTDSSIQKGRNVPYEQYFSNDYRDIQLDADMNIIDLESQLSICQMPKGSFVTSSGLKYMEQFQKDLNKLRGPKSFSAPKLALIQREIKQKKKSAERYNLHPSRILQQDAEDSVEFQIGHWIDSPLSENECETRNIEMADELEDRIDQEEDGSFINSGNEDSDDLSEHIELRRSARINRSKKRSGITMYKSESNVKTRSQLALQQSTSEITRQDDLIYCNILDDDFVNPFMLSDSSAAVKSDQEHCRVRKHRGKSSICDMSSRNPMHPSVPCGTFIDRSWLLSDDWRSSPSWYSPQLGDSIILFPQAHELHPFPEDCLMLSTLFKAAVAALCTVIDIEYGFPRGKDLRKSRSLIVKLTLHIKQVLDSCCNTTDERKQAPASSKFRTLKNPKMFSVYIRNENQPEFLVLREKYDAAAAIEWRVGRRISANFNVDGLLTRSEGEIIEISESDPARWPGSPWEILTIRWDSDKNGYGDAETSRLNAWEVNIIEKHPACSLSEDLKSQVINHLQKISQRKYASHFIEPVDIEAVPQYDVSVPLPMDISKVLKRLVNHYYRNLEAVKFDLYLIIENCSRFNSPNSVFVEDSKLLKSDIDKLFEILSSSSDYPACAAMKCISRSVGGTDEITSRKRSRINTNYSNKKKKIESSKGKSASKNDNIDMMTVVPIRRSTRVASRIHKYDTSETNSSC